MLLKAINLPAAIEENLREVMGFELDRHTPFMASQVYYDVKLQRRDAQRETIEVLLAVAARWQQFALEAAPGAGFGRKVAAIELS